MTIGNAIAAMFQTPGDRLVTRPKVRRTSDWTGTTASALRLLNPLPAPGETLHFILGGNSFPLSAVVPAIVNLTKQPCALVFSTLGIRPEIVDTFCQMHRAGQLTSIAGLLSYYFAASDRDAAKYAVDTLRGEGHRVAITRTHAKLLLLATQDSTQHFVCESSANLRSCKCAEQATLTDDRNLFDFYSAWIDGQLP